MKKTFLVALLVSCGFLKADDLTQGLLAHYGFNGNANDSSGNGRNLNFTANSQISYGHDTYLNKQVLSMSGSSRADYFTSPDPYVSGIVTLPENLLASYSFGMWIKPAVIGRQYPEWTYLISSTNPGENFMRYGENTSYNNYKQFGWVTIEELSANAWQHVAITKEGNLWSFYFNGISRGTFDIGETLFDKNNYYLFNSGGWTYPFEGSVSDVVIYDRALSSTEVAQLVPEPSALSLLAVGLGVVLLQRRRTV